MFHLLWNGRPEKLRRCVKRFNVSLKDLDHRVLKVVFYEFSRSQLHCDWFKNNRQSALLTILPFLLDFRLCYSIGRLKLSEPLWFGEFHFLLLSEIVSRPLWITDVWLITRLLLIPLGGLESLQELHSLDISHNELITCRGLKSVLTLQWLDISHNHLPSLDDLDFLGLLQHLNASNNNIIQVSFKSKIVVFLVQRSVAFHVLHEIYCCVPGKWGLQGKPPPQACRRTPAPKTYAPKTLACRWTSLLKSWLALQLDGLLSARYVDSLDMVNPFD